MKDYGQIISKIGSTPWLITQEGLAVMMSIVDSHLKGTQLSEEDLEAMRLSAASKGNGNSKASTSGSIGVIPLHGPIFGKANLMTEMSGATSLEAFKSDFRTMMDSNDISSVILDIDSPGGTSDLVKEVGAEIFSARGTKPVHAIANTQAASAAYWLGSQADKMYVTPSGSVGSVGAYTVHTDQSNKDAKDGLKYTFVSAGPYKTEGNPHEALSAEGAAYYQERIDQLYTDFVDAIASGRNMTTDHVRQRFGGGRMVTPKNALDAGMVDGILSFDNLVGTIQNQPHQVQIQVDGQAIAMGMFKNGVIHLESKEWEHSEPGTGPTPRRDEDGSEDKAIKGGWRRNIPAEDDRSISPAPPPPNSNLNKGGENELMETVQDQLFRLFGVNNDDDLLTKVTAMHTEQSALDGAVSLSAEERRLAKEFPHFWNEHQERTSKERVRNAREFVENITMFSKPEGDKTIETGIGLSALAIDEMQAFHLKFAEGKATLADFESAMNMVAHGGTVDYKEHGSERVKDKLTHEYDTNTPVGLQGARQAFAKVIDEVQADHKDDKDYTYGMAVAEAAEREPELAAAYRQAGSGG